MERIAGGGMMRLGMLGELVGLMGNVGCGVLVDRIGGDTGDRRGGSVE